MFKSNISLIKTFFRHYKKHIFFSLMFLLIESLAIFSIPLIYQMLIDIGIVNQDLSFLNFIFIFLITTIVIGQTITFIRKKLIFGITYQFSIQIMGQFLIKHSKLRFSSIETNEGKIIQSIDDIERIKDSIAQVFDVIYYVLLITSLEIILAYYNLSIFIAFNVGNVLYFSWIIYFLRKRVSIDETLYKRKIKIKNALISHIKNYVEYTLFNYKHLSISNIVDQKNKEFKSQSQLFDIDRAQYLGAKLINQLKNLVIIYFAFISVIRGDSTIGVIVSVQVILDRINNPLDQIMNFLLKWQFSGLSIKRIQKILSAEISSEIYSKKITSIDFNKLCFQYEKGKGINDITIHAELGDSIMLYGTNGSGKSTFMKTLVGVNKYDSGRIIVNGIDEITSETDLWNSISYISLESEIYERSIRSNIVMGEPFDEEWYNQILEEFQIRELLNHRKISDKDIINNTALSSGEKQRIIMARCIYKKTDIVLIDECTNSMDTALQTHLLQTVLEFCKDRILFFISHDLSHRDYFDYNYEFSAGEIYDRSPQNA